MQKILSEEETTALINEFTRLVTLKEKLSFWTNKLPVNYIQYSQLDYEGTDLLNELLPFRFEISVDERVEFSKWVINSYHDLSGSSKKYEELLVIELLQRSFQNRLDNEVDKLSFIRKELLDIKSSFKRAVSALPAKFMSYGSPYYNFKYDADFETFEAFKEFHVVPDYMTVFPLVSNILNIENGYTLGRYWKYLVELEVAALNQGQLPQATLDEKILILHYLGAFDKIQKSDNATKKGIFLEKLIGNDAERIRQRFSSINDLFSPKEVVKRRKLREELEQVKNMFKELGLENIVKTIQADIRKLSA
jgi:hypothetical protein